MLKKTINALESHSGKLLWIIISMTLISGALYSAYLGDAFRFYDEGEYYLIAKNIHQKGFYTINGTDPSAWRPPGFPAWLFLWLSLGLNIFCLRMLNFLLLCASLWLVYKILEPRSKLTALCGVVLMSVYPVFFFTASTLYPQILVMTFFLLSLHLLFRKNYISYFTVVFVGVLYGILTLTVVTFFGSLFITAIWLAYCHKAWKKAIVMIAVTFLVITPWTVRNYVVFDAFIFIANNGGIAFVLGNSPETQPNLGGNIALPKFDKSIVNGEVAIDRHYKATAINYIIKNKFQSFKMYLLKLLNYFNYSNVFMTKQQTSLIKEMVLFFSYYFLLGLVIFRFAIFKKFPLNSQELYLVSLYLAHGLFLAIFITRIRYRLPYDPLLAILGSPAVAYFLLKYSKNAGTEKT
jgi:hypothetical protein